MAKVLTDDMKAAFDKIKAIGEIGTQLFWWNKTDPSAENWKFEYALPLVSGGEYGGDVETIEAPELDLDYVPLLAGRTTLSEVTLTTNYTKARYHRWLQIISTDMENPSVFLEVFSDNSAALYSGTSGRPTIQGGDVRQIETTVAPSTMVWIEDITNLQNIEGEKTVDIINSVLGLTGTNSTNALTAGGALPFDVDSIPAEREKYFHGEE